MFSEKKLRQKLEAVNQDAVSVESFSAWMLYHKNKGARAAPVLVEYFGEAPAERQLALVYALNDVVQKGVKRAPELVAELQGVLAPLVSASLQKLRASEATRALASKVQRVVGIWRERAVLPPEVLQSLEELFSADEKHTQQQQTQQGQPDGGQHLESQQEHQHPLFLTLEPFVVDVAAWEEAERALALEEEGSEAHQECLRSLADARESLADALEMAAQQQRQLLEPAPKKRRTGEEEANDEQEHHHGQEGEEEDDEDADIEIE